MTQSALERRRDKFVSSTAFALGLPGFKPQICHFLHVELWAHSLETLYGAPEIMLLASKSQVVMAPYTTRPP